VASVDLLGTFWGWLMGPHSGLSLRGGTGYPAPHWNLELGHCWWAFALLVARLQYIL